MTFVIKCYKMEFDKFFSDDQNKFDYIHMATFKSSRAPVIKHNYNNISSFERCLKGNNQILTMLIDLVTMRHALWLTTCRTPMPLSPHSYKNQEFTYGILRSILIYVWIEQGRRKGILHLSRGKWIYKKLVTPVGCTHYRQEHLGRESSAIYRNRCNRDKNMWQMNETR